MGKKRAVTAQIKVQVTGGQATPALQLVRLLVRMASTLGNLSSSSMSVLVI